MVPAGTLDRRTSAGTVCAYCGLDVLDGSQEPEHPIPAALDSSITIYTVCTPCNRRAGREVDTPWLRDPRVMHERARWPITARRAQRSAPPASPLTRGAAIDPDGNPIWIENGVGYYNGSIEWREDEDLVIIRIDEPGQWDAAYERAKKQAALRGFELGEVRRSRHPGDPIEAKITLPFSPAASPRMGAKLALGFGAELFEEAWRLGPHACYLRNLLWAEVPKNEHGVEQHHDPTPPGNYPLIAPPNHLAHFAKRDEADELHVYVSVMGRIGYFVPIGPVGTPIPSLAWRSGPDYRGNPVVDLNAIVEETNARFEPDSK